MRMHRIGRGGGDLASENQALAARGTRATLMRVTAMDDDGNMVEVTLKEALIGIVADRWRHFALCIRNHAVGGYDHITFDTTHVGTLPLELITTTKVISTRMRRSIESARLSSFDGL